MPQNKDQLLRYKILDECFRNTSQLYDMNTLVERVQKEVARVYDKSVSKRSVQNDVRLLQFSPYNVEFDEDLRKQGYYRYADTNFKLEIVKSFTEREQTAIKETINLLKSVAEDVEESTPLQQYMYLCLQRIASGDSLNFNFPSIAFENNELLAGMENFGDLAKAIINKQSLKIIYRSFRTNQSQEIKIYPHLLKQYNGRWYLIATTDGYDTISTYPLDRILDVHIWKTEYKSSNVDLMEYFKYSIGVTVTNGPVEEIVLKVSNARYLYIQTKPFSEKQKVLSHDNEHYLISFPMRINKELVSELLSYGKDVEVVEPEMLRNIMSETVKSMSEKYFIVQKDCTI